jgi:hypothetical protein
MVPSSLLDRLDLSFELRTPAAMRQMYEKAQKYTSTSGRDTFLRQTGIHDIRVSLTSVLRDKALILSTQNFAWDIPMMNPYAAYSYDVLHRDDLGKFGHHLWPLILKHLKNKGSADKLTLA